MSSISSMDAAYSGMQAAQAGMLVTSQNINGSQVDGFTRRNSQYVVSGLAPNSFVFNGTTFSVDGFVRSYSGLLDSQRLAQKAQTAMSGALVQTTATLDSLLVDKASSVSSAMVAFFNAAGSLVSDPNNVSMKSALVGAAQQMADRFNAMGDVFKTVISDAQAGLQGVVDESNVYANSLASVNTKITASISPGNYLPSADLLDERDRLMAALQDSIGGQAIVNSDGTASVFVGGQPLVERGQANRVAREGNTVNVYMSDGPNSAKGSNMDRVRQLKWEDMSNGKAGAYLQLLNQDAQSWKTDFDTVAVDLAKDVNKIFNSDGLGADLLVMDASNSASGLRAASLKSGDFTMTSDIAKTLSELRAPHTATASGSSDELTGYSDRMSSFVSGVANTLARWTGQQKADKVMSEQLDAQREAISGVNLDEEAANMTKYQQLYAAAGKIFQSSQRMFDDLLAVVNG